MHIDQFPGAAYAQNDSVKEIPNNFTIICKWREEMKYNEIWY